MHQSMLLGLALMAVAAGRETLASAAPPDTLDSTIDKMRWCFATAGDASMAAPAQSADGSTVYVGSDDHSVYALSAADGSKKWSFATVDGVRVSPAVSADGLMVYVVSDADLYALSAADGSNQWMFKMEGPLNSTKEGKRRLTRPAASADGSTVYVGGRGDRNNSGDKNNSSMYALRAADGTIKWKVGVLGYFSLLDDEDTKEMYDYTQPATVSADGSILYFGTGTHIYALSAADGSTKWCFSFDGGGIGGGSPAISPDGSTVYAFDWSTSFMYALSAATGRPKWRFGMMGIRVGVGPSPYQSSPPVVSPDGSTVYISNFGTIGYALDTADGSVKWTFQLEYSIDTPSTPALLSPDASTLYIGIYDTPFVVHALSTEDGLEKWKLDVPGSRYPAARKYGPPTLSRDGTMLYIGSDDHHVCSLRVPSLRVPLAPSNHLATKLLCAAGVLSVLALALGMVLKKIRRRRTSDASEPLLPVIADTDEEEADGVDLLVFVCEEACRPQVDALKKLMRWEEHNFSTGETESGPPDAVGPVRLFVQLGVDSNLFANRLREKRPRWLHFMGHGSPSDLGPGQLSLSHGAALQPDEVHNIVVGVAVGVAARSRLELICFSSCNVLSDGNSGSAGGRRPWVKELGKWWHVIGFETRALATPGLVGFFQGVYAALLNDPARIQDAFRHGWMAGVSVVNGGIDGTSFVVGDPAPSEGESYVYKNPSGEEGYWRVAFGVPLLLSPGEPGAPPAEHAARLFEDDNPWERYPACARKGCCNMAEDSGFCGDDVCQPTHVQLGRLGMLKRRE